MANKTKRNQIVPLNTAGVTNKEIVKQMKVYLVNGFLVNAHSPHQDRNFYNDEEDVAKSAGTRQKMIKDAGISRSLMRWV